MSPRKVAVVLACVCALTLAIMLAGRGGASKDARRTASTVARPSGSVVMPTASVPEPPLSAAVVAKPAPLASAKWGSRRGELGRDRPGEGNPEGPMSFATSGKNLLVVDQTNGRLVTYDETGKVTGSRTIRDTVQDVAVGKDGTVALLDRMGEKTVSLSDSQGRPIGNLQLPDDPGTLTGVFVDGDTVYVEQQHGGLVGIGTTDGQPLASPLTLGGRPTKDGALLVTGTLAGSAGTLMVNAIERASGTLRWARVVQVPKPSDVIVLLDSDDRGVVYAGVGAGQPETATIACLDPSDGHVLGRVVAPMSQDPEESFRDFSVEGDGTIVYALRSDDGVSYDTTHCP